MAGFVPSIKNKYKERRIHFEKQWPPCHSSKLVRLELVQREKGESYFANKYRGKTEQNNEEEACCSGNNHRKGDVKRSPLDYCDLFKADSAKKPIRKVLVEGDAGMGKTTLSISVSKDWACGKLFQEFELLLLLSLRHKKVATACSLPELLKFLHPSPSVCRSVAEYLEETEGVAALVIADGWDELSETQCQEDSFIYQLLFEEFPLMSVIVTSRPFASSPLHRLPCIDRFVEINGFSKEDIKSYIRSEFSSDQKSADRLLEQIAINPLVESVCSVPLNCVIVCHLWHTLKGSLPTTMTMLYKQIILNVILRNVQKNDAYKNTVSISSFNMLPEALQQSFWHLCEFAFQALKNNQIVFSREELIKYFPQGYESILCFGLLQTAEPILETGYGVSFHFLHLTFQEYLAALHLARKLSHQLTEVSAKTSTPVIEKDLVQSSSESQRFSIVWRFLYGLYFNVIGCSNYQAIQPYLSYADKSLVLCHCAFEASNIEVNNGVIRLLQERNKRLPCSRESIHPRNAHDCTAVLYVIGQMQEFDSMMIDFSGSSITANQVETFIDLLANKDNRVHIELLNLDGSILSNQSISALFHQASGAFRYLEHLSLCDNPSALGISGIQALENAVNKDSLVHLEELDLRSCLTSDANTNAKVLSTFGKALSSHCPRLRMFGLSKNNLGVPGATVLARVISEHNNDYSLNEWLIKVDLSDTKLGDEGLRTFIEKLDTHHCFDALYLNNNNIHAIGVSCLARSISDEKIQLVSSFDLKLNDYNSGLTLDDNPLGLDAVLEVGRIILNTNMDNIFISLQRCQLTAVDSLGDCLDRGPAEPQREVYKDIGYQLFQMCRNEMNVWHLDLSGNCFTGEGIHILVGLLCLCPYLESLDIDECGITSDDLGLLLDGLAKQKRHYEWPDLKYLNLGFNEIDDSGAYNLTKYLHRGSGCLFPKLIVDCHSDTYFTVRDGLVVVGNPMSTQAMKSLKNDLVGEYEPYMPFEFKHSRSQSSKDTCDSTVNERQVSISTVPHVPLLLGKLEEQKEELHSKSSCQSDQVPSINHDCVSIRNGSQGYAQNRQGNVNTFTDQDGTESSPLPLTSTGSDGDNQKCCDTSSFDGKMVLGQFHSQTSTEEHLDVRGEDYDNATLETSTGFQTPRPKRHCLTDLRDVAHHHVDLIKWKDDNGAIRKLKCYSEVAHKWDQIATRLGFELGEIESIRKNNSFNDRVTVTFRRWFEDAINLPNAMNYPKSWVGLIELLKDAELGEVAQELLTTLSSTHNSVRGNL